MPTTSTSQSHNANFLLATNNINSSNSITNGNITTHINSNEALHTRLTFTSPKLVNSRGAAMAIDCYESDTVDSSMIKEEPLSPDSSCPPSPIASTASTSTANILDGTSHIIVTQPANQTANANSQFGTINVNLANVATYTNTDLVFEHNKVSNNKQKNRWHDDLWSKNGWLSNHEIECVTWISLMNIWLFNFVSFRMVRCNCHQPHTACWKANKLSWMAHNRELSYQNLTSEWMDNKPKVNTRIFPHRIGILENVPFIWENKNMLKHSNECVILGFGLPPTPPSSLSSDDSEDNQSAEIHTIPSSPASSLSSFSPNNQLVHQQSATSKHSQSSNGSPNSSRGYSTSSSRQPIHTPLISNQPVCWSFLTILMVYNRLIDRSILFFFRSHHPWALINLMFWYVTIFDFNIYEL